MYLCSPVNTSYCSILTKVKSNTLQHSPHIRASTATWPIARENNKCGSVT